MFNKSFNLPAFISDLPSLELRGHVLRAVVGSINATLIGAATTAVRGLIEDGYDVNELSASDVAALLHGPETGAQAPDDFIAENKALFAFGSVLREKLVKIDGRDDAGSIANTLGFMTGQQRSRNVSPTALDALKAAGITFTEDELKAARDAQRLTDQARADHRATIVGPIEWFVDNVFVCPVDDELADPEFSAYAALSEERREILCSKTLAALNSAVSRAKQNTLFGGKGLGVSDIIFATKAIAAMAEGIVAVREVPKPTVVMADAPSAKAKRVRKPAAKPAAKPATAEQLKALVEHAAH